MTDQKGIATGKKKKSFSTIILVIILLLGLGIMLYPMVSDYWNSFHQTRAIANYEAAVQELDGADYEEIFAKAEAYNQNLRQLRFPFSEYEELEEEYRDCLDVAGNGIIGYITIDKIGVQLPIYHGTGEAILNVAVGHLEGSSLPIGGESRHSVLSAHRGLPSAKLFTDLDKLEAGDVFTLTVLDRLLTYEVDQILIVEPDQIDALYMEEGMDYCTLQTCTPYGINTHRLLVRGHRVENAADEVTVNADAVRIPPYIVVPAIAIPVLFVLLVVLLLVYSRKSKKITTEDIRELYRQRDQDKGTEEK